MSEDASPAEERPLVSDLDSRHKQVRRTESFGGVVQHGVNPVQLDFRMRVQEPREAHGGILQKSVAGFIGRGKGVGDAVVIVAVEFCGVSEIYDRPTCGNRPCPPTTNSVAL